jgi:hypothetical protein
MFYFFLSTHLHHQSCLLSTPLKVPLKGTRSLRRAPKPGMQTYNREDIGPLRAQVRLNICVDT